MVRRARVRAAAALAVATALTACGEPAGDDSDGDPQAGISMVTFRLWDEAAAAAYRESFDAFNAIHPDVHVDVEVVAAESYSARVASDFADGTMADVFWTTSDAVAAHAHAGDLVELAGTLGDGDEAWEPAVTELYTRDGELWAVPQLWDTSVLFYNTELVARAGVDPAALTWDPAAVQDEPPATAAAQSSPEPAGDAPPVDEDAPPADGPERAPTDDDVPPAEDPGPEQATEETAAPTEEPTPQPTATAADADADADTLRQTVRELTRDAEGRDATEEGFDADAVVEYGINTDLTAPAVWLPFLAQVGGGPAADDELALAGPEAEAAFGYLAELRAAPQPEPASGVGARELFTTGRMALYQASSADMGHVADQADIDWGLASVPSGPHGAVSVVDGVAAAANAHSENPQATEEVLRWLASSDGQSALASHGVGVPAATGAQDLFARSWSSRGVDASAALDTGTVVTAANGPRVQEVLESVRPILAEMFHGQVPVPEALTAAEEAAGRALGP